MALIGWSIVGFFGVTMFSGSVFFGFDAIKNRGDNTKQQSSSGEFISLGVYDVDVRPFYQQYQGAMIQYQQSGQKVSPILHEQILFQAFRYAVNQQAYFIASQEEAIEVIKEDVNAIEQEYLLQVNLKDRSSLKKKLKEQKVSYKDFRSQLEKDALVRKFQSQYPSDININTFLIENTFKQFKVDYLVVDNNALSLDQLKQQSDAIVKDLNGGKSIVDLQKTYEGIVSINSFSQPDFQDFLSFDVSLRDQLVKADANTYLDPYCQESSCGIIRLLDVTLKPKPADYNDAEYAASVKNRLQQDKLQRRINQVFDDHPITVYDPLLNSVYLKNQGKLFEALNVYQELLSLNPSDPAPHFFRAEIYVRQGNVSLALQELEKASLKAQMLPETDFAELHVFYGDLLLEDKQRESGFSHYELAFSLVQNNSEFLTLLKERYKQHSFNDQLSKFDDRLAILELEKKEKDEQSRKELDALLEKSDNDVSSSTLVSDSEEEAQRINAEN
ncbi:hypothetical protein CL658_00830 [bacterium]|nr:hypothetical protein [bacterium]